ncbi:MAG: PilZ domain-containing protein [Desulfobacteraceae bacterium]|nr:PilZ domain-containing protein [Desulfobacteraceae bacterium]
MDDKKILIERRKYRRFKVKHPAFVVFNTQPTRLGEILDISMNGLSFRYMVDSEEVVNQSRELDILYGDDDFYLDKLPFSTISDRLSDNGLPFSTMIMRRRGVQFGDLNDHQREKLEYFIENNTSGEI